MTGEEENGDALKHVSHPNDAFFKEVFPSRSTRLLFSKNIFRRPSRRRRIGPRWWFLQQNISSPEDLSHLSVEELTEKHQSLREAYDVRFKRG